MKVLQIGFTLSVLAVLGAPITTPAAPLYTFSGDCGGGANCFGSTYTLIIGDANDAQNTTYTAQLTINTANYNGPGQYIDSVDFKVVNGISSFALTDAPGGAANWSSVFNSGQAATDCGSGGGFFVCARDPNPNNLAPVTLGIVTWDWTFSSTNPISFGHIGASYNNAAGTINGNNTSISYATLSTPTTILLLASGLIALAGLLAKSLLTER
jgi:hypothetical protein